MTDKNIDTPTILAKHAKWLRGEEGAQCANLHNADLRYADLRGANLSDADLNSADLRGANLRYADLRGADLRDADLRDANLRDADLGDADLLGANLRGAKLLGATHAGGETMTDAAGGYWWMAFRSTKAGVILRYGCECHPLEWWRAQTSALSVKHGEPAEHWRTVEAVIALAATLN